MRAFIAIVCIVLVVGAIGAVIGHGFGRHMGMNRVALLEEVAFKRGYDKGHAEKLEAIKVKVVHGSVWHTLWIKYGPEYGTIHNTPWEKFNIKEKMFLCAYGSTGNKMSVEDLTEVIANYGPSNLREHYGNLEEWGVE